jgi:putative RNA 2'-phosphotransferase
VTIVRESKFLSLLLRHAPETIGLELDEHGWASIDDLVGLSASSATPLTTEMIELVVRTSDKQRFRISDDGLRVRANQGHSLEVDLELRECAPPDVLYHGTALAFLPSIRADGLVRGARQHVHLSADAITARRVGARHGAPVVLEILATQMATAGAAFYLSENGVWLTHSVHALSGSRVCPSTPARPAR